MAFDAGAWIEEGADPSFLRYGLLRETLGIPLDVLDGVLSQADGRLRMRVWSAEVWCRSALGGCSIDDIEQELWLDDPARAVRTTQALLA
jgi:hypothetical protein